MTKPAMTANEIHRVAAWIISSGPSGVDDGEVIALAEEVVRLRHLAEVKYELLASERGYDALEELRPRIANLYMALNARQRGDEHDLDGNPADPWNRLVGLSMTALTHWLANARWAVTEHREAERLRALVGEPSRDVPADVRPAAAGTP